jgi:hypothetical protein
MKSSSHFPTASPSGMRTPYPSGASGDWCTFVVGVFLIALFLSVLAFSPTGTGWTPGVPAVQYLATRPAQPTQALGEALALQDRNLPAGGGKTVFAETRAAENL